MASIFDEEPRPEDEARRLPAFYKMTGISAPDLVPTAASFILVLHPLSSTDRKNE